MDCYGNGKGTALVSVDHKDQDPLNNTMSNLRIATRKEQEQNSKGIKEGTKRSRKSVAKSLPEGLEHHMIKKYVVFYHEVYDKEQGKERMFFKVENHPLLDKSWISSKSGKVPLMEKLAMANKVVEDLDNGVLPPVEDPEVPKYVSLRMDRGLPTLFYEKRNTDKSRLNLKMVMQKEYDLNEHLSKFKDLLGKKYPDVDHFFDL